MIFLVLPAYLVEKNHCKYKRNFVPSLRLEEGGEAGFLAVLNCNPSGAVVPVSAPASYTASDHTNFIEIALVGAF